MWHMRYYQSARQTSHFSEGSVQNGLVAGGRNAPELHPSSFGLVRANWIYALAKYGSREMRRMDLVMRQPVR